MICYICYINIFNRMFIKSCILHELFCSNDSKSIILLNIWQLNPSGSPHSLLLSSTPQSKIQFLEMHFASLQNHFYNKIFANTNHINPTSTIIWFWWRGIFRTKLPFVDGKSSYSPNYELPKIRRIFDCSRNLM